MDDLDIGTIEFADFINVSKDTVSIWRKATYFPQIGEIRWLQICEALTELAYRRGRKVEIGPFDLVEFCPHELRDIKFLDYQCASRNAGRKRKSSGKDKNDVENTVAV